MNKKTKIYIGDIKCQNCGIVLAKREKNGDDIYLSFKPTEIESFTQELTEDTILETFQCPDCGCLLQVKTH
jgi:predicted RNA-binding Zn-ribbon protein involved in translation (DUF1610 family)